jgi:pimeloyl-ACP methyl ester carboxylesterase
MPTVETAPGVIVHYAVDDHTDPWTAPPTVLMLHGLAESRESWRAWVPAFARRYRVLRPDLRGYGASTPMPADYAWRFDRLVDDAVALLDALGLERVHVVGAKIGGTIGLRLAASRPDRVMTLAAVGAPASLTAFGERAPLWREQIRREGVRAWARDSMHGRLGTGLPEAAVAWWVELMARTAASTLEGFLRMVPTVDVTADLPRIACPTLVVTTTGSGLGSADAVRAWQRTIPHSRLVELPGDSYHAAASDPDRCAEIVRAFLDAHDPSREPAAPAARAVL